MAYRIVKDRFLDYKAPLIIIGAIFIFFIMVMVIIFGMFIKENSIIPIVVFIGVPLVIFFFMILLLMWIHVGLVDLYREKDEDLLIK